MQGHVGSGSARPDEWGTAVATGDATKLAQLVLVWSGSKPEPALSILRDCVSLLEEEVAFSAPAFPAVPLLPTMPGPSRSSCLEALIVALNETCDAKSWYTSTKELQLASLEFCMACRNYQTLHLKVDAQIPRRLLARVDAPLPHPELLCRARVPRLRARRVTWDMRKAVELSIPIFTITDVDCLKFGGDFVGSVEAVAWPRRLKTIEFAWNSKFNKPVDLVEWPESLQTLNFGKMFNQPIEHAMFPASLRQLTFLASFNQPIVGDILPSSLKQLDLGMNFNQPIEWVCWPDSLQKINFGTVFNQPIDNVMWPSSLQDLTFGSVIDLEEDGIAMHSYFDQRIDSSGWPMSLRRLTLGDDFKQSLQGLGTWMPNLEVLRLLDFRDSESGNDSLLLGIGWPRGLRQLAVYEFSKLDGVAIPSTVEILFITKYSTDLEL